MADVRISNSTPLVFGDGRPVRAASAIAPFGSGWLIAQDDETLGAWWRDDGVTPVRLFPAVDGHDRFSEAEGTKKLKPDVEAAVAVEVAGAAGVLLLGSGSLQQRMRAALAWPGHPECEVVSADMAPLYEHIAAALSLATKDLNLEGACALGDTLRWFQRGHGGSGVPSSSVDVDLAALLDAVRGRCAPADVRVGDVRRYEFESSGDVSLAITDAAVLDDGRILVSVAAEDAPDAVADGDVVAAGLAIISGGDVVTVAQLPSSEDGTVHKVEGLAVRGRTGDRLDVLAVVDQDDPEIPSLALDLEVTLKA